MSTSEQETTDLVVGSRDLLATSDNPKNRSFPEIVTVTHAERSSEATEEHKLTYKSGEPKGTILVKKLTTIRTTVRTTTPYTGTL